MKKNIDDPSEFSGYFVSVLTGKNTVYETGRNVIDQLKKMRIQKVQKQYFEYSSTFRIVCTQRIELTFKTCAFPFLPSYIVPNENF